MAACGRYVGTSHAAAWLAWIVDDEVLMMGGRVQQGKRQRRNAGGSFEESGTSEVIKWLGQTTTSPASRIAGS